MVTTNWKVELLGNIATLQRGFDLPHRLRKSGNVPIVTSSGVEGTHSEAKVRAPGVVTGRYGTIGEVFYVDEDFWPHNTTLYVRNFHGNDPLFISYLLRTIDFHMHSGKTGVPGVNRNDLHEIELLIPLSNTEQKAIAEALSDADALIEALEQLIAKKRQVKQGAMQELLTGKKRVVESGKWEVKTLEELIDCLDNLRVPLNETQRMKMQGDYPYCGANGVLGFVDSYVIDDEFILIAEDGGYFDEYATRPIAYKMSGKCWVNNHAHILKAKQNINQDFIYYSLVHKNILSFLASGTRAKLNKSEMYKIEIDTPSDLGEQTAIAEILSDMDAEIAALEGKLSKAREVKAGMMSVLLTGKVRLV